MNELKFNSQVCTTKEQSQRLLALGLKPETADMYHTTFYRDNVGYEIIQVRNEKLPLLSQYIPAWSLHRLIEMYNSVGDGSLLQFENITYNLVINCICMAIATGSFPKQYLNE